jgi:hypothetical protein
MEANCSTGRHMPGEQNCDLGFEKSLPKVQALMIATEDA